MKIGIDARMYGLKHAGIGRYVENLISNLLRVDKSNDYTLLVREADKDNFQFPISNFQYNRNIKIKVAEARHYSVKEQFLMPLLLAKENLDLVHFPHFNVPLLYSGKFVVTIHDLLWHETKGNDVTTLPNYLYRIKYTGYRLVFANAVKRAQKILVPSNWVKKKLVSTYNISADKIIVTYEGVDNKYFQFPISNFQSQNNLKKYQITKPFFIYTGSAYPHKNLERLIDAVKKLNSNNKNNVQLAIACARDMFWEKLRVLVQEKGMGEEVKLLGFVPDEDLKVLYHEALAFVFPSLSEGFGLPGLEAMSCGCPIISSSAGSLPEIYGDAALYFDPLSVEDMAKNLRSIIYDLKLQEELRKKGLAQAKKYLWEKMVRETLAIYEKV